MESSKSGGRGALGRAERPRCLTTRSALRTETHSAFSPPGAFRRRDAASRTLLERRFEELAAGELAWPLAAGELGAGGNGVVLWSLVGADPMARWLACESLEYEGRAAVLGVPCDVVVIPGDEPHETTRVFLATRDRLPRKVERIGVMLNDRISGSLLTLSEMNLLRDVGANQFELALPQDHELRLYEPVEVEDTLVAIGAPAPSFSLRDPDGREHTLAELCGRTVVLDFWGTWCGPCIRKLPDLQRLHAEHQDRPVTVLGISCHEAPNARPAQVMNRYGCEFDLLLEGDLVAEAYGVAADPSVVVIAGDGRVAFRARGGASLAALQAAVDATLSD